MDKKFYLNNLYDYYQLLFTEKQREYFEEYFFNDLSLSEIAENSGVSRNAVHGQIKIVEEKLEFYESVLKLFEKAEKIRNLLDGVDSKTREEIEKLI